MQAFNPPDPGFESRVRSSFNLQQLMKTISAKLVTVSPGEVHIEIPYQEALTQQNGFIHAGVIRPSIRLGRGLALGPAIAGCGHRCTICNHTVFGPCRVLHPDQGDRCPLRP